MKFKNGHYYGILLMKIIKTKRKKFILICLYTSALSLLSYFNNENEAQQTLIIMYFIHIVLIQYNISNNIIIISNEFLKC
jgi:hypothetical protein